MIHANCRERLTADDFDFLVRVLGTKPSDSVSLAELLLDHETRDALLDHETVATAILDSADRLRISGHLFFYVLCRRVLRETRVSSREAADYIASLLEAFSREQRVVSPETGEAIELRYLSDMLAALGQADAREAFLIRSHIANYALFTSGIFFGHIGKRAMRGAPDVTFYEQVGSANYRAAAEHRDARRFDLSDVYREISDGFREARLALNDLAERVLHLDAAPHPMAG